MQTRKSLRKTIALPGRYFSGHGAPVDVALTDLSIGGCRFKTDSARLALGTALQIMIANTGPHHATIKWVRRGEVGVTFARPLTEDQFRQFQHSHVPDLAMNTLCDAFEDMPGSLPRRFC